MRVLHLSDTHLGCRRPVIGPGAVPRADDHYRALQAAVAPALAEEVDLVVHSGDVFDRSRPPRRDVERGAALLREVARRVPVVLIPGNHDRRGIQRSLPHRQLQVADRPTAIQVAGVRLALVPYFRDPTTWARAAAEAWGGGADLLVCHQAWHGSRVPGLTFRVGAQADTLGEQHLPAGVEHLLCGHIHPRQAVAVGSATVVHPGSTERTAFSEAGQPKGSVIWTLERQVQWRFVDHPTRRMVRLEVRSDLETLRPGDLVRLCDGIEADEVYARGGWVWGAPRSEGSSLHVAAREPRMKRERNPAGERQLGLPLV